MYNSIPAELFEFLVFCLVGSLSSFLFDTLRALDFFKKTGVVVCFLKDLVYWIIITLTVFLICLKYTDGEIRLYMMLGIFAGACLYFNTVSKYVLKILYFLFNILKKTFYSILLYPMIFVLKLINKPVFIAVSFSKKRLCSVKEKIKFNLVKYKKFKR